MRVYHLRQATVIQRHAPDKLHIIVPTNDRRHSQNSRFHSMYGLHALQRVVVLAPELQNAPGSFAHDCECLAEDVLLGLLCMKRG